MGRLPKPFDAVEFVFERDFVLSSVDLLDKSSFGPESRGDGKTQPNLIFKGGCWCRGDWIKVKTNIPVCPIFSRLTGPQELRS
jgi:hypothetical protein